MLTWQELPYLHQLASMLPGHSSSSFFFSGLPCRRVSLPSFPPFLGGFPWSGHTRGGARGSPAGRESLDAGLPGPLPGVFLPSRCAPPGGRHRAPTGAGAARSWRLRVGAASEPKSSKSVYLTEPCLNHRCSLENIVYLNTFRLNKHCFMVTLLN